MPSEVDLGGHKYSIGRLSAKQQFHVSRRLGTVAAAFAGTIAQAQARIQEPAPPGSVAPAGGSEAEPAPTVEMGDRAARIIDTMQPFLRAIGQLSDEESDYITDTCLAVVSRQEKNSSWAPIFRSGQLMYQDITVSIMLQLVWRVLEENLGNFFEELLSALPAGLMGASLAGTGSPSQEAKTG